MRYGLGVDLGTTHTAAAVLVGGRVELLRLGNRRPEIPSLVFVTAEGALLVGDAAERRGAAEPERLAREFKRRLGDPVPLLVGGSPYPAHVLMAKLLRRVYDIARSQYEVPPSAITVTHPANWGPFKRELLDQAIHLADVDNVLFLPEPEAAAIHYATTERVQPGETVAVYDLGGGTFDAAVLRRTATGFELLGRSEGIEQLGGIDFDEAVFAHVLGTIGDSAQSLDPEDELVTAALARLRRDCTEAKEALSYDTEVMIPVALPGLHTRVRLNRSEFEAMIAPALTETVAATARALRAAGVTPSDLRSVVLAGGSSRIPLVSQLLDAEFSRPVTLDPHPEHSVAMGAAATTGPLALGTTPARPMFVPSPPTVPPARRFPARVTHSGAPSSATTGPNPGAPPASGPAVGPRARGSAVSGPAAGGPPTGRASTAGPASGGPSGAGPNAGGPAVGGPGGGGPNAGGPAGGGPSGSESAGGVARAAASVPESRTPATGTDPALGAVPGAEVPGRGTAARGPASSALGAGLTADPDGTTVLPPATDPDGTAQLPGAPDAAPTSATPASSPPATPPTSRPGPAASRASATRPDSPPVARPPTTAGSVPWPPVAPTWRGARPSSSGNPDSGGAGAASGATRTPADAGTDTSGNRSGPRASGAGGTRARSAPEGGPDTRGGGPARGARPPGSSSGPGAAGDIRRPAGSDARAPGIASERAAGGSGSARAAPAARATGSPVQVNRAAAPDTARPDAGEADHLPVGTARVRPGSAPTPGRSRALPPALIALLRGKRRWLVIGFAGLLLFAASAAVVAWPRGEPPADTAPQGDTGSQPPAVPGKPAHLWSFDLGGPVSGRPVVSGDAVYVGDQGGKVHAIERATGRERWRYDAGSPVNGAPLVRDGVVYIASKDGTVHAIAAADGGRRWQVRAAPGSTSSPVAGGDTLYVGGDDGLSAFRLGGERRWRFPSGGAITTTPAVSGDTVFASGGDGKVYAIDANSGNRRWATPIGDGLSAPVAAGGLLYVGSAGRLVHALEAGTGRVRWTFPATGGVSTAPLAEGGTVYFGASDGLVYAVNAADGSLRWRYTVEGGEPASSSPSLAERVLYVGSRAGRLYALEAASGAPLWQFTTEGPVVGTAVADGVLYAAGGNRVYALQLTMLSATPPAAPAPALTS